MANILFIGKAQKDAATAGSGQTTITHGLTIDHGDLLVAFVNRNGSSTEITTPAGWTEIKQAIGAETSRYWIGYKVAGTGEPASYTWTIGLDTSHDIQLRQFRSKGTELFISDVTESSTAASSTVAVTTAPVPVGAISFVYVNTDTSGVSASAVDSEYVEHYNSSLSARQQYSAHRIVDAYSLDASTVNFTSSGATTSENNHFYISFQFPETTPGPNIIRRPRTKQPPTATAIDWTNSLTRNLKIFAIPQGNTFIDVVTGGIFVPSGDAASSDTTNEKRLSRGFKLTTSPSVTQEFTLSNVPVVLTARHTIAWGARSSDVTADVTGAYDWGSDTAQARFVAIGHRAHSGAERRHANSGSKASGSTFSYNPVDATIEWPIGTIGIAIAAWDYAPDLAYMLNPNGVFGSVAFSGTADNSTVSTWKFRNAWAANRGISHYLGAVWEDRCLTEAEMRSFQANPWQIFKPNSLYLGKPEARRVVVF